MPKAKQISLNNTLIDIGDGNCEIWDITESSGSYSITGHSTPYADITTALNNNTSVVLRHPDGRLFYLAGNFGTGSEARYSFTYNEATTRMIIGIYSNNTITYTTPTGGAPQFHRSTDTTYGIGSENYYGHNKVINNLTTASYTEGESLSAYQGKVLKDAVDSSVKKGESVETTLSGSAFASLAEFVTATNTDQYRHGAVFNFKDSTGWCPAGSVNIWYRCFVQYQNTLTSGYSVGGNVILFGNNLTHLWIGYITGTTAAEATIAWSKGGTASYLSTPATGGYETDGYGNFKHNSTTTTNMWTIKNNAGSNKFSVNFESGDTGVAGNITADGYVYAKNGSMYVGSADTSYSQLIFRTTNNAANNYFIRAYDADTEGYGQTWVMKPGGNMIIGGGEFATSLYNGGYDNCNDAGEKLYLGSDSHTYIYSNGNTIADRKAWQFNSGGTLYLPDGTARLAQDGNLYINSSANGVTGWLTTILNGKQASITGGASTITSSNLTASRALVSTSAGKVGVSAVTSTELGYLDGVTSNIQTQLNHITPVVNSSNYDEGTMNDISVTNNVNFDMGSFQLTKGRWLISLNAQFNANATGYRQMWLSNSAGGGNLVVAGRVSSPAANGAITQINVTLPLNVTATTTYYIVVRQNCGSALTTSVRYSLVRLLDQS